MQPENIKIPQRATMKDLCNWYVVSRKTMQKWLQLIPNLGRPKFENSGYSRNQIKIIFNHLEPPECYDNKTPSEIMPSSPDDIFE